MSEQDSSGWAKHLKHPLVLVGFVIMLLFGLVETLLQSDVLLLADENTQQFVQNSLWYAFALGFIVSILGFLLAFKRQKPTQDIDKSVVQKTKGAQSPAIVSQGEVNISYDGSPSKVSDNKDHN
jgi:hypothetical protein